MRRDLIPRDDQLDQAMRASRSDRFNLDDVEDTLLAVNMSLSAVTIVAVDMSLSAVTIVDV